MKISEDCNGNGSEYCKYRTETCYQSLAYLQHFPWEYLISDHQWHQFLHVHSQQRWNRFLTHGYQEKIIPRLILLIQSWDRESALAWWKAIEICIQLVIMDGTEKIFQEEFLRNKVQCCQVHVTGNVLTLAADDLRSIIYVSILKKGESVCNIICQTVEKRHIVELGISCRTIK